MGRCMDGDIRFYIKDLVGINAITGLVNQSKDMDCAGSASRCITCDRHSRTADVSKSRLLLLFALEHDNWSRYVINM